MTGAAEFGLLGPFTVRRDGAVVVIPPGQQRALLAALLLSAGRPVSLDRLAGAAAARLADLGAAARAGRARGPAATHAEPGAIAVPGGGRGSVGKVRPGGRPRR